MIKVETVQNEMLRRRAQVTNLLLLSYIELYIYHGYRYTYIYNDYHNLFMSDKFLPN